MRVAITISFVLLMLACPALADEALHKVTVWTHVGYVLSAEQAEAQKAQLLDSLPEYVKFDGFWTPTDQDVAVADRAFHDQLKAAIKDPTILFPSLSPGLGSAKPDTVEYERRELTLVVDNYDAYQRQYFGIIIDGIKYVFCNYAEGPKFDGSGGYIYMQNVFVGDGTVHFLQCRFEPILKNCTSVSIIGSWQSPK